MTGFINASVLLIAMGMMGLASAGPQRWQDDNGVIYYRNTSIVDATYTEPPASTPPAIKQKKTKPAKTPGNTGKRKQAIEKEQDRQRAIQQRQCDRWQAKMEGIEQKLDDGYREPQGNKLRRQRREVKSQLFRECS